MWFLHILHEPTGNRYTLAFSSASRRALALIALSGQLVTLTLEDPKSARLDPPQPIGQN